MQRQIFHFEIETRISFKKAKKILENSKLRLKEIQGYVVGNCVHIGQNKWDTHFDTELPWKFIWAILYSNRPNRKAKQLQFKLLYNIVYTEERLQRMGLSLNGSCHFCKEKETLLHVFVHCKFVDSVWIEVVDKFSDFFLRKFNILAEKSVKNIGLGIFNKNLKKIANFVNTILLSTKYFIWKERNVVKYQKKAMSKIRIINLLKLNCRFYLLFMMIHLYN